MSENKKGAMGGHGHHGPGGPMGGRIVEKPKEFKKTGKRLLGYFKPYRAVFIMVFIFEIGRASCRERVLCSV